MPLEPRRFEHWTQWSTCKVYFRDQEDVDQQSDDFIDVSLGNAFWFEKGDRVRTHGLNNAEFNHLCGHVLHNKPDSQGRYVVALELLGDDNPVKKLRFKPENLVLLSHPCGSMRLRYTMVDIERCSKTDEQKIKKLLHLMDSLGEDATHDVERVARRVQLLQRRVAQDSHRGRRKEQME